MGRSLNATDAAEEMPGNAPMDGHTATAALALKGIANTTATEVELKLKLKTLASEEDSGLANVDLSTLEGGPSFANQKSENIEDDSTTTTTPPLQSRAVNIPREPFVTAPAVAQHPQPFRFGQTPQPTGIRYPPGFHPQPIVARPQRQLPTQPSRENTASPHFVPAAPPSALSPLPLPITTPAPSLPIPNSREFTFNARPSPATSANSIIAPSFPDTTLEAKTMFLSASHRKRNMAMTPAVSEYEADLTSKDRMKQKEAVKNVLAQKVRCDWAECWVDEFPGVGEVLKAVDGEEEVSLGGDGQEGEKWVERAEWESELSGSEDEDGGEEAAVSSKPLSRTTTAEEKPSFLRRLSSSKPALSSTHTDPFRFENPDTVGETLKRKVERKKIRRQKRFVDELRENEGLRCFTVRRNVWTGAKIVRRPIITSRPVSASSTANAAMEEGVATVTGNDAAPAAPEPATETENENGAPKPAQEEEDSDEWTDVLLTTLIPIPPPLLPASTPMRKAISPRNYTTIYDKIILGGQTPLCPINLQTVVSSCVEGWKRDGEWPPRGMVENGGVLNRRKEGGEATTATMAGKRGGGGGNWRRSFSRVFGGKGGEGPV